MTVKGIIKGTAVILKKSDWILIGCSWLLVQIMLFVFLGINNQEEAIKYIALANQWMKGNHHFHLTQSFLFRLCVDICVVKMGWPAG